MGLTMVDKTAPPRSFESLFSQWVITNRWLVVAITLIVVVVSAYGVGFLTLSTNYRIFFDSDNPQLLALESLESAYGKSDNVLFVIDPDDGDALSEQALMATTWLTEQAWQTPYSTRVDSITNFQHTTADGDELLVRDLVDPTRLNDEKERLRIRTVALTDPRLAGKLLSSDGSISVLLVTVSLPQENQTATTTEIAQFAYDLAAQAKTEFPGIDLRVVGTVIINHVFAEASITSQKIFLPTSLAIMALALVILTRRLSGVLATGLVMVLSVVVSLGLGGWAGLPFSPPVAPAPTIVLMIVVANSVHLLATLQQRLQAGDPKHVAIRESIRINLSPVFLASLTTTLGFLAMNFAEAPPHRHLGSFVAFGIVASFIFSVTFLPALLSLLPMRTSTSAASATTPQHDPLMSGIAVFVIQYRKILLYGSTAVVLAFAAIIPRNELNDVLVHFFDESTEFRQDVDFLDKRLSGNTVIEYSLVSPQSITDPAFLQDVSAFAEWYQTQPEVRHVSAITDTFRKINQSMHGDDANAYRLPESRQLASQYLLLYELSLPFGLDLTNQISADKSSTRMTVTAATLSSKELLALDTRAQQWLTNHVTHIVRADSAGPALLFAHIGQRSIKSMLLGTVIVLSGISIVLLIAFRSIRMGLVSLVPNFVPVVVGFGIWGLTVAEIGSSLSVVVAMTIGIVVDDTVHFLSKYQRARREFGYTPEQAVSSAFQTVGRAIFTTTIVLVAGFLVLLLSPFIPTAQVGLLTALIIGFALVFDFVLLPPLLMAIEKPEQPDRTTHPAQSTTSG